MSKDNQGVYGTNINSLTFGSKIEGNISADSDFRIDGQVIGNINCSGKLVIGTHGQIKGDLICSSAEIIGMVEGNLKISETITLRSTAVIKGDVFTKNLVVEPGATFNGSCTMKDSE